MDYREEMKQLRETLNANGYLYYVLDAPTMSDYEYDHLLRKLEDLGEGASGGDHSRFPHPAGGRQDC